jgi:carbon-monoxide dehydrogenase medium subunit
LGVAAVVTLDENNICRDARLVYLNAGDGPVNAKQAAQILKGQPPSDGAMMVAATAAEQEINPTGSIHASPDYQRHLARVLTRRALKQAFERASQ